ncbi:MAG: hypothetical protein K6E91_09655 [Butyrivibrio sp.]|nr:hypothetical protein [Butyrivibrio sp.]
MKLNYSFTKREIILIFALILVLIGLLYYRFVYVNIRDQAGEYDTADMEAQIQQEQMQLVQWAAMAQEIDEIGQVSTSSLYTYDNQKNEINLLNDIFAPVIRYNFSFQKPVATGDTVRRNVTVSFTTIDYNSALDIIHQLHNSKYRVLLKDISISPGDLTVDYLTALATEALVDEKAMNQLKKQVGTLINAGYEIDPYVMKVYNGEPLTEASETELTGESAMPEGMEGQSAPEETLADAESVISETDAMAGELVDGGSVETLADGTIVAPTEVQSETQTETETEKPIQTLENSLINVSMSMTFYETAYGAESLDGLIIENAETTSAEAG